MGLLLPAHSCLGAGDRRPACAIAAPLVSRIPTKFAWVMGYLGFVGIVLSGVLYSAQTPYPGSAVAVPVMGAVLVIGAGSALGGPGVEHLLAPRPAQWLGARSYSWYLRHWPLLVIPAEYAGKTLSVWDNLFWVLVALVVAMLSYWVIEKPIRGSRGLRARPLVSVAMGACLILASLAVAQRSIQTHSGANGLGPPSGNVQIPRPDVVRDTRIIRWHWARWTGNTSEKRKSMTRKLSVKIKDRGPSFVTGMARGHIGDLARGGMASSGVGRGAQFDGSDGPPIGCRSQCSVPACTQVLAAVRAGTKVHAVPNKLSPGLADASADIRPPQGYLGCVVNQSAITTPFPCVYNAAATTKRMVLIGDSHAEMWSSSIAAVAKANGYSLLFLAKIPCPLPMVALWNALNSTPNTQCTAFKKWAISKIQQFNPSIVIATTEDFITYTGNAELLSQKAFSAGLATTLKDFAAPGRRVILLGDIPYLSNPGPICLAAHEGNVQSCSTPTGVAVDKKKQQAERSAATAAGASFIDVIPWFCTTKTCPAVVNNLDVYPTESTSLRRTACRWRPSWRSRSASEGARRRDAIPRHGSRRFRPSVAQRLCR